MGSSYTDNVLAALEAYKGQFVSGGKLAKELGCSRNTVWKAVAALEQAGYRIESVTGKGYRLASDTSILSAASIQRYLHSDAITLEYHDSIGSTNTRCKESAEAGAPAGTLVVADQQSAGRGRQGRPFFSPAGTGVYFSLLLRPDFSVGDITAVTSYAAVAVARAIEAVCGKRAQIKWVNDVFVGGHKVCGILTEASLTAENAHVGYVVIGIGINVHRPRGGFPDDVADVAYAISDTSADEQDLRARLVAAIADDLMTGAGSIPSHAHLDEYRARSLLDGRDVDVYEGEASYHAHVIGVNDDFTLRVRLADGKLRNLASGEVHIPSNQL